ncbi:hypothetical protein [Methylobacterium komagatae]
MVDPAETTAPARAFARNDDPEALRRLLAMARNLASAASPSTPRQSPNKPAFVRQAS